MVIENYCQLYRQKAQLLQKDVAEAMGISQQEVSRLEKDPLHTDLGKLLAYADVLGVPLVVIVPGVAHGGRGMRNGHASAQALREKEVHHA